MTKRFFVTVKIEECSKYYVTGEYNNWSWDWDNFQYLYDKSNNVYEGWVYFDYTDDDGVYKFKITNSKDFEHSQWPISGDYDYLINKSCKVKLENNVISFTEACENWSVSGEFNGWGNDKMTYGFDGEHYLIAENVEIIETEENKFYWKIRGDGWIYENNEKKWKDWSTEINSATGVKVQGDAEGLNDQNNNFIVTAGAGTYEFKRYFNLPQPKIVVTKK